MRNEYSKLRDWYQLNVEQIGGDDDYPARSRRLIKILPKPEQATDLEVRAIFQEVLMGLLEWAYVESDGESAMNEYASEALSAGGFERYLNEDETNQLRKSRLWPYLTPSYR